jgi:uncharacterized protein YprB with RNaseH-like and TPR domain
LIDEAFLHCRGMGPARLAALHAAGVRTWAEARAQPEAIAAACREAVLEELERSQAALDAGDASYFVQALAPPDRWRVLTRFLPRLTYVDLETTGLEIDDTVTAIGCFHRGELRVFVEHEDLDDFLDLLDDVEILASFNGSSFDVPRLLSAFHIPELPCPHLDLRWALYHRRFRGSQAAIEEALGEARPDDVTGIDGARAVELWDAWRAHGDARARQLLLRYCGADVLALVRLAHRIGGVEPPGGDDYWSQLPDAPAPEAGTEEVLESRKRSRTQVAAIRARLREA